MNEVIEGEVLEVEKGTEEISQENVSEVSEGVATVDYTPYLEEINVRLNNIEILLTDIFNFIYDFSIIGITVGIGLLATYALWKEGLKW